MTDALTNTEQETAPRASAAPSAGRLKVLVAAYACSPCRGSEGGVGWGWVKAISEHHDLWVLVGAQFQREIDAELDQRPELRERLHFQYVPRKRWRLLEKLWPPAYLWTYRLWQKDAYRLAVELHKEIGFDLAHQLTYVGFRVPGHLWRLGIPFVWGPIGGLENVPWRLLPMMGVSGAAYYAGRNIINSLHKRFLRLPKRAFAKAALNGAIIAATQGIRREVLRWYGVNSQVICEIGTPAEVARAHSLRSPGEPLRLAWSGLHLPGKALPLLLRALPRLPDEVNWHLDVLGQGPCTNAWRRLARRLGVDDRCTWHGWLPRDEAVSLLHDSHVFIITSLKDLTSTVLLEALSQGVPVICLDHCGFRDVVTPQCGIKVRVRSRRQIESDITAAIESLWRDEARRRQLAKGALLRIRDFSWTRKAERISKLYQRGVRGEHARPGDTELSRAIVRTQGQQTEERRLPCAHDGPVAGALVTRKRR